ncbi:MAG: hypothetical protein WBG92_04660 [Thiohalocapsa sp.]
MGINFSTLMSELLLIHFDKSAQHLVTTLSYCTIGRQTVLPKPETDSASGYGYHHDYQQHNRAVASLRRVANPAPGSETIRMRHVHSDLCGCSCVKNRDRGSTPNEIIVATSQ